MAALGHHDESAPLGGGNDVLLAERYRIAPDQRLPQYDSPTAKAFVADDEKERASSLFALICGGELPPRIDLLKDLSHNRPNGLLAPQGWGVIYWPPANEERFAIVFERPLGERVVPRSGEEIAAMNEDSLVRSVIRPLVPVLQELHRRHLTHRAIRADNLFFADPAGVSTLLGECVSTPPGYGQPVIYETMERGLAPPIGRGPGTASDDLYAFGVLLMVLCLGHDICSDVPVQEIVNSKIGSGTYAALLGRERIPIPLLEPLRGLLCDNPDDRWTVEEMERWLEGRSMVPKQVMLPTKAQRALSFAGDDHMNLRTLAYAMAGDWDQAMALIQGNDLTQWVRRSLSNDVKTPAVLHAFTSIQGPGGMTRTKDQILFHILLALDPIAPLRYKQLACTIDGFGAPLAAGFHEPEVRAIYSEVILNKLPQYWLEAQPKARREYSSLKRLSIKLHSHLTRAGLAFGLERCLYYLNPGWPCQSPILKGRLVFELSGVLVALESIAEQGGGGDPVDAHIASFCAAKMKLVPEPVLRGLAVEDDIQTKHLAMLGLLAEVQDLSGPQQLPALAAWFVDLLRPSIKSIHSVPYRSALEQELDRTTQNGNLHDLLGLIHNKMARHRDSLGFAQAKAIYGQAEAEIAWLEEGGLTNESNVTKGSEQTSVLVSAVLSGFALVLVTLFQVL